MTLEEFNALLPGQAESALMEQSRQGARLLHLALELDRRIYRGVTPAEALAELRLSSRFDRVSLTDRPTPTVREPRPTTGVRQCARTTPLGFS